MGLYPKAAVYYQALTGIPRGPYSKVFVVDPQSGHGDDNNPGTTFESPLATIQAAFDKCTANHNDAVLVVGGPTGNALAAAIDWNKAYTHLIGLSADIPGVGQRARITGSAALDLLYLVNFSASGCIVKNVQFFNGYDSTAAHGAVKVTADRVYFENCFFVGMGGNCTHASTYDLWITSEENVFKRCTIGSHTVANGVANSRVLVSGTSGGKENKFIGCEFFNWSTVTTTAMVRIANSVTTEGFIMQFEDCLFDNLLGGATMANVFEDAATEANHQIILRGNCQSVGITGIADNLGDVWMAQPVPVNTGIISINPAG